MQPQTGNHKGGVGMDNPQRHTDENDGDDVVHNDVDLLFPVWLLVLLCSNVALGFGTACSLLYLLEDCPWLVIFLRKLSRPLSYQVKFRLGSLKVTLSTCLNAFHSGLLSKGPDESADVDHDHHLRLAILRSKLLATGRPTSNSHGRGRSRPQPQGGGAGGTHTTGNHKGGEGGIPWGGAGWGA